MSAKNYDIGCDCVVVVCRLELCLWSVAMIKIRRDWVPWVEFRQVYLGDYCILDLRGFGVALNIGGLGDGPSST